MERNQMPPLSSFMKDPSRASRIEAYLYDEPNDHGLEMAAQLYRDQPIHRHAVLIPVAAHQEASNIPVAMDQYAAQHEAEPFSILLSLNSPEGSDQAAIGDCIAEDEQSIDEHPELDIRYAHSIYQPNTPIGSIRKDLWDATSYLAMSNGLYQEPSDEVIAVNHDIDTISIGRHYMRNIQRYYDRAQTILNSEGLSNFVMPPMFTQVKHHYPFDTHPNIAKAMVWVDASLRQYRPNGMYEEGLVIPLSHYSNRKGFDPNDKTYETGRLLPTLDYGSGISRTPMETSPRRYVQRLGQHGLKGIWSNDSFGANDACRGNDLPADITVDQLESNILESFETDLSFFSKNISVDKWQNIILDTVNYPDKYPLESIEPRVDKLIRAKHRLAEQILRRVVQSDSLAELAIDDSAIKLRVDGYTEAVKDEIAYERHITQNATPNI